MNLTSLLTPVRTMTLPDYVELSSPERTDDNFHDAMYALERSLELLISRFSRFENPFLHVQRPYWIMRERTFDLIH